MPVGTLTRREFLRTAGLAAAGLLLGVAFFPPCSLPGRRTPRTAITPPP